MAAIPGAHRIGAVRSWKGLFTGAAQRYAGRFEQAQGGTLFLDEIGDMPMEAETRSLRVLQESEYHTVGGTRPIRLMSELRSDPSRPPPADRPGAVPRGSVLQAQCRADPAAALARAARRHPRSGAVFPDRRGARGPAAEDPVARGDRADDGASLARQHPRARESSGRWWRFIRARRSRPR